MADDLPTLDVVAAAIIRADRVLVARRGPGMSLPGVWEFPGGKVEPGESRACALRREILEELGVDIEVGEALATSHTRQPARVIQLTVFACHASPGPVTLREHDGAQWLRAAELRTLEGLAAADVPLVPAVVDRLTDSGPA